MLHSRSNGQSIIDYIPPDLRRIFYKNPARIHASHNGLDPYGFSTEGLVLYLPLWALQNNVGFKSVDAYKHTITPSGAFWTPEGFSFDGTDDIITIPDHAALQFGTGDFTVIIWMKKVGAAGTERLFNKSAPGVPRWEIVVHNGVGSPIDFVIEDAGNDKADVTGTTATNDGWHMVSMSCDRDSATGFVAYVDDSAEGAAQDPTAVGDLSAAAVDVSIGAYPDLTGDYEGLIGEAWLYKGKAYSAVEIARHFNVTAWRY